MSSSATKEIQIHLPRLHPAQMQAKREAKRFNALNWGRRTGKDVLGHEIAVEAALDGKPFAWFAPTYRMMLDTFEDISKIVRPVSTRVNASEHRIDLVTRGLLDFWSLDTPDVARGRKYAAVVVNEAAMVPNLLDAWNAVIRPTLADYAGSAWFLSTPKGRNGFALLCQQAKDEPAAWQYSHKTTFDNPYIARGEIVAMKDTLPERTYAQEVMAEFLENQGSVFRNVRACCTQKEKESPKQHEGHTFVMGVDWAKAIDFTRLRVGCIECRRCVDWDGFNRIDFHFQRDRLKLLADKWQVKDILAESNAIGEPNIEELQRSNLPVRGFETTAASKPPLIESLALALERSEWTLPEEDADELETYELKLNPNTNRPTYSAPEGGHDDRVIADALMNHAAHTGGPVVLFEA